MNNFENQIDMFVDELNKEMGGDVISCGELEFYYEGEGSGRIVYNIEETDYVIKHPKNKSGEEQTEVELFIYSNEKTDLLCPNIYIKGKTLVQPNCEAIWGKDDDETIFDWMIRKGYSNNEISVLKNKTKRLINKYNLLRRDILKCSSWGIYESHIVLVDYGCTKHIYDLYYKDTDAVEVY